MRRRSLIALVAAAGVAAVPTSALPRDEARLAASGTTQVVARAGGREITLSELRAEMTRLGLSAADAQSERLALESVLDRALLAEAARQAQLHRRPEGLSRMRAAQDAALAELFLATAAQPSEPTRAEIDDYVRENPTLFADRRLYEFSVLTLPTAAFDEKALTPLFDEEKDFGALAAALETQHVDFSIASIAQPSTAFPKQVREQLAQYSTADNIVVKGPEQTQIMKIMRAKAAPAPADEWPAQARRLLLEEDAQRRAQAVLERLRREASVAYYRPSAAPAKTTGD